MVNSNISVQLASTVNAVSCTLTHYKNNTRVWQCLPKQSRLSILLSSNFSNFLVSRITSRKELKKILCRMALGGTQYSAFLLAFGPFSSHVYNLFLLLFFLLFLSATIISWEMAGKVRKSGRMKQKTHPHDDTGNIFLISPFTIFPSLSRKFFPNISYMRHPTNYITRISTQMCSKTLISSRFMNIYLQFILPIQ